DWRPIDSLVILPKVDLREVAAEYVHELPRGVRALLEGVGAFSRGGMQLVSYLLFESPFTRELIAMGYRDAMAMRDELVAFLNDEPIPQLDAPIPQLDAPSYLKKRLEQ